MVGRSPQSVSIQVNTHFGPLGAVEGSHKLGHEPSRVVAGNEIIENRWQEEGLVAVEGS